MRVSVGNKKCKYVVSKIMTENKCLILVERVQYAQKLYAVAGFPTKREAVRFANRLFTGLVY